MIILFMANWFTDALKTAASSLVGGLPGAMLGMGTSVIGSLVSNNMNRSNQALTQAWQEKMNLQQQEWQEGMWNKTNEYNNASNQMQRLMDAGINPNAAAAQVAGTNSAAQLAQQPQIPAGNPIPGVNMDLTGGAMQGMAANKEMQLLDAQREGIEIDNALKLRQTDAVGSQIKLWEKQGNLLDIDILNKPREYEANIDYINELKNKAVADAHYTKSEAKQLDYIIENILPVQKRLAEANVSLTQQEFKESVGRTAAVFAQAALAYEQRNTEKSKQDLLEKQTEGQGIENTIRGIDALFEFGDKFLNRKYTAEQIKNLKFTNKELEFAKDFLQKNGVPMEILNSSALPDFIKLGLLANVSGFGGNEGDISSGVYMHNEFQKSSNLFNTAFSIITTAAAAAASGVGAGVAAGVVAGKHIPGAKNAPPYKANQGTIGQYVWNNSSSTWNYGK